MRKSALLVAASLSLVAGGAAVWAQGTGGDVISSQEADALDEPETWSCDRIGPEYSRWLDEGNSPDSWRYVGKTYRDANTGELYNWQDWLEWADENSCGIAPVEEILPFAPLIAPAITALGAGGLLASSSGARPMSPG